MTAGHDKQSLLSLHIKTKGVVTETVKDTETDTFGSQQFLSWGEGAYEFHILIKNH